MIIDPATLGSSVIRPTYFKRLRRCATSLLAAPFRCSRRHRVAIGVVLGIWSLAYVRVFFDPTPHVPLLFNWTPSLPYRVALVDYAPRSTVKRGDFVIYTFDGPAQRLYPGLHAQPFFKQVAGLSGDRITVIGRAVFLNDTAVGIAKPHTFDGHPLDPVAPGVIPPGSVYVRGSSPDSFDSRYQASGLVRTDHIIGKVIPLF